MSRAFIFYILLTCLFEREKEREIPWTLQMSTTDRAEPGALAAG